MKALLEEPGRSRRAQFRMYAKTGVIVAWILVSWAAPRVRRPTPVAGLTAGRLAGPGPWPASASTSPTTPTTAATRRTAAQPRDCWHLDLIGASSFVWRTQHNIVHHTFTNISGADSDIDRCRSPRRARSAPALLPPLAAPLHLAALRPLRHQVAHGRRLGYLRMADRRDPAAACPRGRELTGFCSARPLFLTWALVIPRCCTRVAGRGRLRARLVRARLHARGVVPARPLPRGGRVLQHRGDGRRAGDRSGPATRSRRRSTSRRATGCWPGTSAASTSRSSTTCSPGYATSTTRRWRPSCRRSASATASLPVRTRGCGRPSRRTPAGCAAWGGRSPSGPPRRSAPPRSPGWSMASQREIQRSYDFMDQAVRLTLGGVGGHHLRAVRGRRHPHARAGPAGQARLRRRRARP